MMDKEQWRPILGYDKYYEVSNKGGVRRIHYKANPTLKYLKPRVTNKFWYNVNLCVNSKARNYPIHRLVAIAFIPNPENKPCVNHKDSNGFNNKVENLEWCTHKENMQHAARKGRMVLPETRGSKNSQAILNERDVLRIKMALKTGLRGRELAKIYGVAETTISMIKVGRHWTHIKLKEV